jgi:uncharacterized membrane protein YgcG
MTRLRRSDRLAAPETPRSDQVDATAFTDRVMATIETMPRPTPARSFRGALRGWSWPDARASLTVAWHLATVRSWSVAPRVRAQSMALVLAVASVLATGTLVAASAVRMAVPIGPGDRHVAPPMAPADGIADPAMEPPNHGSPGEARPGGAVPVVSGDADHHVAEPDDATDPTDQGGANGQGEDTDAAPGGQGKDAGSGDSSPDGGHDGSAAHDRDVANGSDDGEHDGGSTTRSGGGAHDGGSGDGGSSDSQSGGSDGGGSSHDGGDGGD